MYKPIKSLLFSKMKKKKPFFGKNFMRIPYHNKAIVTSINYGLRIELQDN